MATNSVIAPCQNQPWAAAFRLIHKFGWVRPSQLQIESHRRIMKSPRRVRTPVADVKFQRLSLQLQTEQPP